LYYERGDREREFPEQYPATYELQPVRNWMEVGDARLVRPLLKNTQLESRPLQVSYDAKRQGWNPQAFHRAVDGKGAAVVLCKARGRWFGGYNPKGWSGNGGARPSVAAFLWYQSPSGGNRLVKLRKVGGGGLACARDDPDAGVWLGPDGLVVPLSGSRPREVSSRLGTYYERGADDLYSLLPDGASTLEELKVLTGQCHCFVLRSRLASPSLLCSVELICNLPSGFPASRLTASLTRLVTRAVLLPSRLLTGVYKSGETIPYSGAVMDFTSG
jgi:hypothetical protein